ncbi:MAG: hypothetical protein LBQ39_07220 [Tannerellaceae bacterium]|jgi:hypothetical protein|nr:hypothetical protein [Tannerellaceae bacterium]
MKYLNLNVKTTCVLLVVTSSFCFNLNAQVTIGSDFLPEKAALLQIKDKQPAPDSKGATATTGGLLLPRVELDGINEFTLIPNVTDDQKKDHTGLLVYNQRTNVVLQLEKGVYQWNGEKWMMLQKTTKTDGVAVRKNIYRAKKPDPSHVVAVGVFEFRMNERYSQFRLILPNKKSWTLYGLLNWDRDSDIKDESAGWPTYGANHDFYFGVLSPSMDSNVWRDIKEWTSNAERQDVWLSDPENDNMYHIQFLVLGPDANDDPNADKTYAIIALKY